jgi:hypothetical protein
MSGLEWGMNLAACICLVALIVSKWSVIKMAQQINQRSQPGPRVSLKWWPNYKDRRVMRLYHSVCPQGRWHFVYVGSVASAVLLVLVAVIIGSHAASS